MGNVVEKEMEQTCSGDVILLVEYKKDANDSHKYKGHSRNYKLYKIQKALDRTDSNKILYEYVMLAEDDKFPILLTEALGKRIVANNDFGGNLAYNVWLNRYR